MSWDAYLYDDRGHLEGEWNCTHNINGMARLALERAGYELPDSTRACSAIDPETGQWRDYPNGRGKVSWWDHLDGMSGTDGGAYLHTIIEQMEADPATFEAMNPENGWGSYAGFLEVLREMRAAVPEWPSRWEVNG